AGESAIIRSKPGFSQRLWPLVFPERTQKMSSSRHAPRAVRRAMAHGVCLLLISFMPGYAGDQPGVVSAEFIYESAPFLQCHASTIALSGESLVAAWFGG